MYLYTNFFLSVVHLRLYLHFSWRLSIATMLAWIKFDFSSRSNTIIIGKMFKFKLLCFKVFLRPLVTKKPKKNTVLDRGNYVSSLKARINSWKRFFITSQSYQNLRYLSCSSSIAIIESHLFVDRLSCNDLKLHGMRAGNKYSEDSFQLMKVSDTQYLPVYCDMTTAKGGFTLIVTSAHNNWTRAQVPHR